MDPAACNYNPYATISDGSCSIALPGYYCEDGIATECPVGTFSVGWAEDCTLCFPGYYNDTGGSMSCAACPEGTFNDQFGADSASDCVLCQSGTYSVAGSGYCTDCPPGFIAPYAGSYECAHCPAGFYNDEYAG